MDLLQKLVDGGHQVRALIDARDYDIQGTKKGKYLDDKATLLKDEAGKLQSKAQQQYSGTTVNTVASSLATKAQALSTDASKISGGGLAGLSGLANALATAAKGSGGSDTSSLHATATELQSEPTNHDKAIAVIEAFKKVKAAHEELAKQEKYTQLLEGAGESLQLDSAEGKVQAVEGAWNGVKGDFQKLFKALIKQFAGQLETKATALNNTNNANARKFKDTYDEFKDVKSTIEIKASAGNVATKKNITIKNLPHVNDTFKPRQIKFYAIIVPSIISKWLNFLTYVILLIVYH